MNILKKFSRLSVLLALTCSLQQYAHAKPSERLQLGAYDPKKPVTIDADILNYDHTNKLVNAEGNVIAVHEQETIFADKMTYIIDSKTIKAQGNIVLHRGDGTKYYAQTANLDLAHDAGTLLHFTGRLNERSAKITAHNAEMLNKDLLQLTQMTFSTCPICQNNWITNTPLWRIDADKVTMSRSKERLDYENATIEVLGVPVFYTPYFSTPAPGAKRKSGILQPVVRWSEGLGGSLKIPIYWNISPNMDLTLTPTITRLQGILQMLEFRHRTPTGQYKLSGSFTMPNTVLVDDQKVKQKYLGHVQGDGEFEIAGKGYMDGYIGVSAARVHDKEKTYLKKYQITQLDVLRSHLYHTHADDNLLYSTELLSFQGLRPIDNLKTTPSALPLFQAQYQQDIKALGVRLNHEVNFLNLVRPQSANYQHVSLNTMAQKPIYLPYGQQLALSGLLRADGYNIEYRPLTVPLSPQGMLFNGQEQANGRNGLWQAEAGALWSWPMIADAYAGPVIFEPIVSAYISPKQAAPNNAPNEDSQYTELSTYNLWDGNRYLGLDRLESGKRWSYGMRGHWQLGMPYLQRATFVIGQHRRIDDDIGAQLSATLNKRISGYVGKIGLDNSYISIMDRFIVDHESLRLLLNEFYVRLDRGDWGSGLHYVTIRSAVSSPVANPGRRRQELELHGWYRFYEDWWLSAKLRTRLGSGSKINGGRMVYDGIGLQYRGECLNISAEAGRDYTRLRDLRSSNTYSLSIHVPTNL
ncbi:MAG: LPS-assembly protein LptD [Proteobacteria bacterium]|nr:LPS-assembly protein LptD [Pseudomonadota bacterium]